MYSKALFYCRSSKLSTVEKKGSGSEFQPFQNVQPYLYTEKRISNDPGRRKKGFSAFILKLRPLTHNSKLRKKGGENEGGGRERQQYNQLEGLSD